MPTKSKRPYLVRAFYDWIIDCELTPYLMVGVDSDQVQVPADYVSDGKIVLNLSPMAIRDLLIDDETVSFSGRFGGREFPISVPLRSVQAIYAKESGEGMMFDSEATEVDAPGSASDVDSAADAGLSDAAPEAPGKSGSHLRIIK